MIVELFTTFLGLTKAFDTVCREGLWKIMAKFGCPSKFIAMVKQFNDGMKARVLDNGKYSQPIPVTTLFSMIFSAKLTDAFHDSVIGVGFRYCTDGILLNFRRLHAKSKDHEDTARDFLFGDGCALNASTQLEMHSNMDLFAKACENFGHKISTKKTEVLHQPASTALTSEPHLTVNGQRLAAADKFVYLGSTLARSVSIDEEVAYRIARASTAFGRQKSNVWECRGLSLDTKLKVSEQ